MSKQTRHYRNYRIEVKALPLKGSSFTAHFDIEDHSAGSHVDVTHFESGKTFPSEAEAIAAGFQLAQLKIDAGL